jgi:2,3-bisphosphoglycerate-independent phosphoglycerate mutase
LHPILLKCTFNHDVLKGVLVSNRKYVIVVPDGAADRPLQIFEGKTVLEAAVKPNIDSLSKNGVLGLCNTVPSSLQPGSDVAMMAVLGYDPVKYYSGRAPIEAVAQGINVSSDDWIFRMNLVTVTDDKMADHSAGHISSEEGKIFVEELNKVFGSEQVKFYPGVGYRHLMVINGYDFSDIVTSPPHDMIGKNISEILPKGENAAILINIINESKQLFADHLINKKRRSLLENVASSVWFWGQGRKISMEPFEKKYGLKGAAITAVDLVKGLAKLIGFDFIKVKGATGYFDTDYKAKGLAAIEAIDKYDIVLVHVEAPDEAGHAGEAEIKKKAIEDIDKFIVGPVLKKLEEYGNWRMLVMPDHPTSVITRGHSGEPVPFTFSGTGVNNVSNLTYGESNASKTGLIVNNGYELMEMFLKK